MKRIVLFAAFLALAACATPPSAPPEFNVVETNAYIPDRALIQEISFLDDDVLLIRVSARELYRVRLIPGCTNYGDVGVAARLADTGPGVDRSTRVIVGDNTCAIRSISRVERAN